MRDIAGFLVLIIGVLISLLFVWFGLRQYGQNQALSEYQTPLIQELMKKSTPFIWSQNQPGTWPVIKINFRDKDWETTTGKPLNAALPEKPQAPLLLFLEGRDAKALPKLRAFMKETGFWERTLFCSRQDGLLKDLRDLEPKWTYCNGEAYLIRLLAFSTINLESLLQIPSDVVYVHLSTPLTNYEMEKIIKEGKRQKKLVIVGPVPRPLEGLSPHGWMVENKDPKVQ